LVEKYQKIKKPIGRDSADWAAKIHIALYPIYYHNYIVIIVLLDKISQNTFCNNSPIGEYQKKYFSLMEQFFSGTN